MDPRFFFFSLSLLSFLHTSFQQRHSHSVIGSSNFMELHGISFVRGFSSFFFNHHKDDFSPKVDRFGKVWPFIDAIIRIDRSIFPLNSVAMVTVSTPWFIMRVSMLSRSSRNAVMLVYTSVFFLFEREGKKVIHHFRRRMNRRNDWKKPTFLNFHVS